MWPPCWVGAQQSWRRVKGVYTPAARFIGRRGTERCFLKLATTANTAAKLRHEGRAYATVRGAFMPAFFGFEDHADEPLLLIEDLGFARWPPPWDARLIEQVRAAIAAVHATPTGLPCMGSVEPGWAAVAAEPGPFLELGLVAAAWLERALPTLLAAEAACSTAPKTLTHFDLCSDNLCPTPDGVKIIDWAEACLGDPVLDLAAWLPSLELEGGPAPEAFLAAAPEAAAWVSGYFAARAGLPTIPAAPRVRMVQRAQPPFPGCSEPWSWRRWGEAVSGDISRERSVGAGRFVASLKSDLPTSEPDLKASLTVVAFAAASAIAASAAAACPRAFWRGTWKHDPRVRRRGDLWAISGWGLEFAGRTDQCRNRRAEPSGWRTSLRLGPPALCRFSAPLLLRPQDPRQGFMNASRVEDAPSP